MEKDPKIQNYWNKMKEIQNSLLHYIDDDIISDEFTQNIFKLFEDQKIKEDKHELKSVLYLLSNISKNHHRTPLFFAKIFQIIEYFRKEMIKYFTNHEIFNIFTNKRIILYLHETKIITLDRYCAYKMIRAEMRSHLYYQYFFEEIKNFIPPKELYDLYTNIKNFSREGENDSEICRIIRLDSINEFIIYINQNNLSINFKIRFLLSETNEYLRDKEPSLIEYSAFFGSIQIFKYLISNKADVYSSIWLYAIHGNNNEIIHIIEEIKLKSNRNQQIDCLYDQCFIEAVKCHHNEIAIYLLENYLKEKKPNSYLSLCLKHYNFDLINFEDLKNVLISDAVELDYYYLAEYLLLKSGNIDINAKHEVSYYERKYSYYGDKTVLNMAVDTENIDLIKIILNFDDVDINNLYSQYSCGRNSFHSAVEHDNLEIVKLLIKNKSLNINQYQYHYITDKTLQKNTVLHIAVEKGNIEMVKFLLEFEKLDVNILSFNSYTRTSRKRIWKLTALHFAIENNYADIVKILLSCNKFDVNNKDIYILYH